MFRNDVIENGNLSRAVLGGRGCRGGALQRGRTKPARKDVTHTLTHRPGDRYPVRGNSGRVGERERLLFTELRETRSLHNVLKLLLSLPWHIFIITIVLISAFC